MLYCRKCAKELDAIMHIKAFDMPREFTNPANCQMCLGPGPCDGVDATKEPITGVNWQPHAMGHTFY